MKHFITRTIALFTASVSINSYAVTIDAGDYTRLPDGTDLALLYFQSFTGTSFYVDGDEVFDDAELNGNVGILRGVKFMDVGNLTVAPQFLLPFGKVSTDGDIANLDSANGLGDLIIAPTIHLVQDPSRAKSLAFTPWLYLPTGDYDADKAINALGENRWKLALQIGHIRPIAENWLLDIIADVLFFGTNDDFSPNGLELKQDPLYEIQSHIRYNVAPTTTLSAMISQSWGGETEIEGVAQDNEQSRLKASITVSHFLKPTIQVLGSLGKDISVDEGVAEDVRFNLRVLTIF
ncbi:transporter [Halioxenophilus aromaticivorans]|uniref:Transporter n=1 Tax=Halioxenophilus aromaticivorans TaxID=1306992 RepID=A0AAV3U4E2_9ALTE